MTVAKFVCDRPGGRLWRPGARRASTLARLALATAVALSGCSANTFGSAPLSMPSALRGSIYIGQIEYDLSAPLKDVGDDFREVFKDEFPRAVAECGRGDHTLDLRVRLDAVQRVQPLSAARSGGRHRMSGLVEFVEPATLEVVGRYVIEGEADAGTGLAALLSDQQADIGEAFGRAVCSHAVGGDLRLRPSVR